MVTFGQPEGTNRVDLQIDKAALKGVKLFLGCPMFDGRCHAEFAYALARLSALCTHLGIDLELYFVSGEPLVMKARNAIADRFLQSGAAYLMLIDADIDFQPADVLAMVALQAQVDGPYDVLCAAYPLKRIDWGNVAKAAVQGLGSANPAELLRYAAPIRLSPADEGHFDLAQPIEVTQAGTGFMMIRRATLEAFAAHYPQRRYRSADAEGGRVVTQFFDTAIDGTVETLEDNLRTFLLKNPDADHDAIRRFLAERATGPHDYVSEDFMFCRLVRGAGHKVWLCPWMAPAHIGSYRFSTGLADLARLASHTA